jgi:hypothetical protein
MNTTTEPEKLRNRYNSWFSGIAGRFLIPALSEQGQPDLISENVQYRQQS